jgi:AraC-like DNA-binding protein
MPAKRHTALSVMMPESGVLFAESIHAPDFAADVRSDPFHKILYVLDGEASYGETNRSTPITLPAGSFIPVPAGDSHCCQDITATTILLLCISKQFVEEDKDVHALWQQLNKRFAKGAHAQTLITMQLEKIWRGAIAEQVNQDAGQRTAIRTGALQILILLARLRPSGQGSGAEEKILHFRKQLESSFFEAWDLDRAATATNLSRRSFSTTFKQVTGKTFLQDLTQLRLEHCRKRLKQPNPNIAAIAFSAGFNDLSHFYRVFKSHAHMTPKQWADS